MGLTLAEMGYAVVAADLRHDFLLYSREKYEHGRIGWVVANLDQSCFKEECCYVVLLCEVLEHCAYPERVLAAVGEGVKPGGILVATTPNRRYLRSTLPTFEAMRTSDRAELAKHQFGPDGSDHLFAFTLTELRTFGDGTLHPLKWGYLGCAVATARWQFLFRKLPIGWIYRAIRLGERITCLNATFSPGIYCVYVKQ
jgi:SAM-dependent methyltransferase